MIKLNNKSRPKAKEDKDEKRNTFDSVNALYEGRELTLNAFRSGIFPIKEIQEKGRPSMLASRSFMLALRPLDLARVAKVPAIALAQVKVDNTSENLLNENQTNYIFFVSSKRNY